MLFLVGKSQTSAPSSEKLFVGDIPVVWFKDASSSGTSSRYKILLASSVENKASPSDNDLLKLLGTEIV